MWICVAYAHPAFSFSMFMFNLNLITGYLLFCFLMEVLKTPFSAYSINECVQCSIVDGLAKYFKSVFIEDYDALNASDSSSGNFCDFSNTLITDCDIKAPKKLEPNFVMGLDSIQAFIVKDCVVPL